MVVGGDVGDSAGSVWLAVMGYQLQRLWVEERELGEERE